MIDLDSQQKAMNHIVFEPQKAILASVGEDDSITLWDIDFESWAKRACRIANRNLTLKEWNTYIGSRPYKKTCPEIQSKSEMSGLGRLDLCEAARHHESEVINGAIFSG